MNVFAAQEETKREGPMIHITGRVLLGVGMILLIPAVVALLRNEDPLMFFIPSLVCIAVSLVLLYTFKMSSSLSPVNGLFMVSMTWILVILVGMVPFILAGMPIADAFFESSSGFTTTGGSVIEDLTQWPDSILFWRSMMQWVGGIAVILVFMSILPLLGLGGRSMMINEVSGAGSKNFSARIKDVTKQFTMIYLILTAIMLVACLLLGVGLFESLCMTMSTISTGGFLPVESVGVYSVAVQVVVMIFMFLGGTSFYLHYRAIYRKDPKVYVKNTEFRTMAVWYLVITVVVFLVLTTTLGGAATLEPTIYLFKDVLFTVISLGTTTGLATVDYTLWAPVAVLFLLWLVILFGGSSGSTAGGIKIYRGVLMIKYIKVALQKVIHPRAIFDIKVNDASVEENSISSAIAVVILFLLTIVVGSVVMMVSGTHPVDSVSMVTAAVTNVGPALGEQFGPMGSFVSLDAWAKVFMGLLMWVGRLEIIMALVLFTSTFWKEMLRGRAHVR